MMENSVKKVCSCCGEELRLKVRSYPMGSVFQTSRIHADIYQCPNCSKIELFAAESDMVVCPVCGVSHPAQERCVNCALDAAFGGKKP